MDARGQDGRPATAALNPDRVERPPALSLVSTFYLVVAIAIAGPQLWPAFEVSAVTYDSLDAHISLWSLWWTRRSIESLANPFWTDLIFHPRGTSLAFHSYPFLYGVLSIPIQHLVPGKAGLALAFNLALLLSFVTSALATYLLALRLTRNRAAALIAGLVYGFAPYHVLNSCRLAVAAIEVVPICLLAFLRLHERPTWGRAVALSVSVGVAYYNASEYGFYTVLLLAVWLARGLLQRDPTYDRRFWLRLCGAALAFVAIAAPLLLQQVAVAAAEWTSIGSNEEDAARWGPALLSFVTPSRVHPLFGSFWRFAGEYGDGVTAGMRSETALGVTTLLLVAAALVRRQRDGRRFFALVGACFLVMCLGPQLRLTGSWSTSIPLPYAALERVIPLMGAIKEPNRIFPIVLLMVALLVAYSVRDLLEVLGPKEWRLRALPSLLAAAVSFEALTAWPGHPVPHWPVNAHKRFYEELAREPGHFSIMDLSDPGVDLATVLAQPVHGRPTVERQGFIPRAAAAWADTPLAELERAFEDPQTLVKLSHDEQRSRVERYRSALDEARVRYVLWPAGAAAGQQGPWLHMMAEALRGSLGVRGGLLVLDLRPSESDRGRQTE